MAKLNISIFPKKSLFTVCIYIGVLIAFIFLIIIPTQRESEAVDKRIIELNTRIEEQKILKPIYQSLQKKAELTPPDGIAPLKKKKLKKSETDMVAGRLGDMAVRSNLNLSKYTPKVETIISGSGLFMIDFILTGEFINLQPFLLELCQTPYLERIEHIQIRAEKDTNEFKFRIWLAYEK